MQGCNVSGAPDEHGPPVPPDLVRLDTAYNAAQGGMHHLSSVELIHGSPYERGGYRGSLPGNTKEMHTTRV